jgi:hypothetical protein
MFVPKKKSGQQDHASQPEAIRRFCQICPSDPQKINIGPVPEVSFTN